MCTVVLLRRPDHSWPILIAANRDEMLDRRWRPPARHWPDRPEVIAGLDELAGGSWMGLNDAGVVVCMLNRRGSLGPALDRRSRGELVLEALDHADAREAAKALAAVDPAAYRPFNMLIADNRDAWWLSLTAAAQEAGAGLRVEPLPAGLFMLTAYDINNSADPRIGAFLPRFAAAAPPRPEAGDWTSWQGLLATPDDKDPHRAPNIRPTNGFGTSSSSLLALPSVAETFGPAHRRPLWLFAAGPPDSAPFVPVALG